VGPGKRRADQDHAVILVSNEGENYLQHGLDIPISPPPAERAAPQQRFASAGITSRSDATPPETVATDKIDATAVEPKRAYRARNRFAAFAFAASLVMAICVGMCFRPEQGLWQTLLQERDRVAESRIVGNRDLSGFCMHVR
jgi:hypothetical protein